MSVWRRVVVTGSLVVSALLLAGCADFADQPAPEDWRAQDELTPQAAPNPEIPGESEPGAGPGGRDPRPSKIPPPDGCKDFNPLVIGTCMDTVTAVAALPGDGAVPAALVGERTTGRILRVRAGSEPEVVAKVEVDGGTDGGLTGLALSPTYTEDRLIFAYITTKQDNRLVRIAPGDTAKPILTGIPRGPKGNRGTLATDHTGSLVLATGDAGSRKSSGPDNLAGSVLRIDPSGQAAEDNPRQSPVVATNLTVPGGLCGSPDGSQLWVTDRTRDGDHLHLIDLSDPYRDLGQPEWSWPDQPGVTGCAATREGIWVTTDTAGNVQMLPLAKDGSFRGEPQVMLEDDEGFGRIGALDMLNPEMAVAGTVNKDGGKPVSSDDRAFVLALTSDGGSGGPD